jgi:hypothetical protein
MNDQSRNDMQVDALVRRLDDEHRPPREFVDETYGLIRAHADEARRRDASALAQMLDAVPLPGRPAWRPPVSWRPALALVLALLALLAWLAFTVVGPGHRPLPRPADHVVFGRGHPGVGGYDLWVIGVDHTDPHLLVAGTHEGVRVSPEGTQISSAVHGLLIFPRFYRSDGTLLRDIHPSGDLQNLNLGTAAWSHDGQILAFEAWDETFHDRDGVYLMRVDGTGLRRLTGPGVPGDFSPDDRQLLITRQEGVFVLNIDGTNEHEVGMLTPVAFSSPGYMPDGRSFYAAAEGRIWIIDLTTGAPKPLQVPDGNIVTPRLSPDGSTFVFSFDASSAQTTAIWVMNVDGTGAHQLVDDPTVNEDFSDWLP